jgi:hypothetical protein
LKVVWPLASKKICDLFAEFIQRTYADEIWVLSDPGPEYVPDDPPFGALQFTSDEVESVLQDLDLNKGSGPDDVPPIILKNREPALARPLFLLFKSMATSVFPDRWKVSYVTPIFNKGRRNNAWQYYLQFPSFELLVYRGMYMYMYNDLKNLLPMYQSTWLNEEPIYDNEPIRVCIFCAESN